MPASVARQTAPLMLICGEDEFAVQQRAKLVYQQWTQELGGMDHEILDGSVSNSGEALKVLSRLREALQTLPFFGEGKVIWLQNCTFLGEERAASGQAVTETLAHLARALKECSWRNGRLLISAGKVDKRKVFYKTIDKLGSVEILTGWSVDDRDWTDQAEAWAHQAIRARKKHISEEGLAELINRAGATARQLDSEIEKLALYAGERAELGLEDVRAICTRSKIARAF